MSGLAFPYFYQAFSNWQRPTAYAGSAASKGAAKLFQPDSRVPSQDNPREEQTEDQKQ